MSLITFQGTPKNRAFGEMIFKACPTRTVHKTQCAILLGLMWRGVRDGGHGVRDGRRGVRDGGRGVRDGGRGSVIHVSFSRWR